MAVNLGIGQRNTKSGIQGNRRTARIPTGPSQTVGVANDPGVAGGPSSIPRGAFGPEGNVESGRQIQAGANLIIADEARDSAQRQKALNKLEADERNRIEKDAMAASLQAAENDYDTLIQNETYVEELTLKENEESKFLKAFKEINPKYLSTMVGASNYETFENELFILGLKKANEAAADKRVKVKTLYTKRATDAVDKIINSYGVSALDPELAEPKLREAINKAAPNLQDEDKEDLLRAKLRPLAFRELLRITSAFGQTAQQAQRKVAEYFARPFIINLMGEEFVDKTQAELIEVAKRVRESEKISEEAEIKEDQRKARTKRYADFIKLWPKEQLQAATVAFWQLEEGKFIPQPVLKPGDIQPSNVPGVPGEEGKPRITKAAPGDTVFMDTDERGNLKQVAAGAPKISTAKTTDSIVVTAPAASGTPPVPGQVPAVPGQVPGVTIFEPEKTPALNPLYVEGVGADGNNVLSKDGYQQVESALKLATTSKETATGGRIVSESANKFLRHLKEVAINSMEDANTNPQKTLNGITAVNDAIDQIVEKNPELLPKEFNYIEYAKRIWSSDKTGLTFVGGTPHRFSEAGAANLATEISILGKRAEEKIKLIDPSAATGFWSAISDTLNKSVGNIFRGLVNKTTQRARFQFGLLARDFIRLVTLSPRFAVREQDILRSIFSGPTAGLSAEQAVVNIREFSNLIDTFAREAFQELEFPLDKPGVNTEKNQLLKDIRKMKDIKHRIDLFDVGQLGGRASTAERKELTYEGASQLSDEEFYEKYGEHRVGSKENPLGGPQVAPQRAAQPEPAPQPAPQPAPEPQEADLEGKINAALTGGLPEWKKLTVADMLEALEVIDLSKINRDMILGELISLGVDVPDNLSKKSPKPKKSKKGKK